MKKALKIIVISILLILIIAKIAIMYFDKPMPQNGEMGEKAEQIAQKMLLAVNKSAWDSTNIVTWTYRNAIHYIWDKKNNLAQIEWKGYKILMNLSNKTGKVWKDNQLVSNEKEIKNTLDKAWKLFINDSFWLNPVVKIYDDGVERRALQVEGKDALLVTYKSGGVTPGDSYLWKIEENGLPKTWQMWVKILPVGGLESSWEDWTTLSSGAKIATKHQIGGKFPIQVTNLKGGKTFEELGLDKGLFGMLN